MATAVFQWFIAEPTLEREFSSNKSGISFFSVVKSFNPTLRELLVSDILIRFCERLPYAFVILWAMNHAGVIAGQFGWLVMAAKVDCLAEALGKLDARRASCKVSLDLLAGVGWQLQVEIFGQQ